MNFRNTLLAASVLFGACAGTANAGIIDEARIGLMAHNICVIDCKNAGEEDGPNINAEVTFKTPGFLEWAWSPNPYLMASFNTAGGTNFGGGGLQWSFPFAENWAFEPGIGYVIHDGELENPYPFGTVEHYLYGEEDHLFLGSEDLFRTSLAVTWYAGENWGAQLMYEHLSHGQILGSGRNQGLDNLGVRFVWKLD